MKIIPAILPKTKDELIDKLTKLRGVVSHIQIDLCDGEFVGAKTWPFSEFESTDHFLRHIDAFEEEIIEMQELFHDFKVDYDIMVRDPEQLLSVWNEMNPENVILHLDSIEDTEGLALSLGSKTSPFRFVRDKKIIFAVSQTTDIEKFDQWYREFEFRTVQVMGINTIGKQGEQFTENTLKIINDLEKRYPDIIVQVDGGVSIENIKKLAESGVSSAVAGSAVFKNNDISENISRLEKGAIL